MPDQKPLRLTTDERNALATVLPEWDYDPDRFRVEVAAVVEQIVKAREAAARREALLEAAAHFESEMGPAWGDNRSWFTTGKHVTSLVAEVLRDLAEPERDEEGS